MGHEHQQRQKSDKPDSDGSVAVQAAPEQVELGGMSALPGLGFDTLRTLQGSIGNAAIGRMVRASNVATAERPTAVSSDTQTAIDAQRAGGQTMPGGVRLHRGAPVQAIARSLNANAFTQGRDVFLGPGAGPETLAHEMTHVSQGAPASGAVMREPAGTPGDEYKQSLGMLAAPPNMLMTGGATGAASEGPTASTATATPGTADPKNLAPRGLPGLGGGPAAGPLSQAPEPPQPKSELQKQPGDRYDIEYTYDGKLQQFKGLDEEEVINHLEQFGFNVLGDMKEGLKWQERWREENGGSFSSRWTAATASLVGGADWPDPLDWYKADKIIAEAMQMLREGRWAVMLATGRDATMDEWARKSATPLDEKRIMEIVAILQKGEVEADQAYNNWISFLHDTEKGASRTVTGLKVAKVAGAVAATVATGGAAGALELGTFGTAALVGTGAGLYAGTQEFAGQAGEMIFSDRDHFDWGAIAKVTAVNAAAGFVGGAIGGKVAGVFGNSLGRLIGGMAPETMEAFGIAGSDLLTNGEKLFVQWLANTGVGGPFAKATARVMQSVLDHRTSELTVSGVVDAAFDNMLQDGAINAFFAFAEPGAGTPERAPSESSGVPEHIGPEGDAPLSPDVSTGIPEPVGPGYEPTQPQGDVTEPDVTGTEPTEPVSKPSDGVPEHIGPEGDAPLSPDVSTGVPEPVGPGYEPTQPQADKTQPTVTGTEPTQPVASNGGVPEHVGPEGDAYYSPDPTLNEANGPAHEAQNGNANGGGSAGGGGGGGRPRRETLQGMGAAGPAGENAPPRRDTQPMEAQDIAGDTQRMQAQPERRFSETSELVDPIDRAPENRMSISGYAGSQNAEGGYGAFRTRVRLANGEVVEAVVKIYPGEDTAKFNQEVGAAQAAAATGMGPEFYGRVSVPNGPEARWGINDIAFAMEPVEGAFAFTGSEAGDPGHAQALAESAAAAARIGDNTIQDVKDYSRAILDQGYYYDGEVQGLIGPNGEWRPIDFGGAKPLPAPEDVAAYDWAMEQHRDRVKDEIDNLEKARREAAPDYVPDDPTTKTRR